MPPQTASLIEGHVEKLVEAHNSRISELQKHLLNEEKLASEGMLKYQKDHYGAAQRIKDIMNEENTNFQKEFQSLKELYK